MIHDTSCKVIPELQFPELSSLISDGFPIAAGYANVWGFFSWGNVLPSLKKECWDSYS